MPRETRPIADDAEAERRAVRVRRIPLVVKVLHSLFLCVLVPAYWMHYGPANFLWFSDISLFAVLFALWLESPLLASMQAVSVTLLELAWLVDFLGSIALGTDLLGLSGYMFDSEIPLFIRGLSLFHLWLPFLLLWMVWRLGYDRRAWLAQSMLAWAVLLVCYLATDPADNINWVFGPGEKPQDWMRPELYFVLVMLIFPFGVYWPSHLLLWKLFEGRR
jgi:hypothetical protein